MADGTNRLLVYKPTSLDFINRPNPVEPQSVTHKHPLDGNPVNQQLPTTTAVASDLSRLLHHDSSTAAERPTKRRKSGEAKSLDLPKPPVRQGHKRLRIPPTLSGLYQPPPDAGLLPSILTGQVVKPPGIDSSAEAAVPEPVSCPTPTESNKTAPEAKSHDPKKHKKHKWSDDETACLLKGVERFGVGQWTQILNWGSFHFDKRTALDLKDRFRTVRPQDYRAPKQPSNNPAAGETVPEKKTRAYRSHKKSDAELTDLGITKPFVESKRRKRHGYSNEEDEALLKGFRKHGKQWSLIRADEELNLGHRTAMDLRDRMRTRYPDVYKSAGLAPRPANFPKRPERDRAEQKDDDPSTNQETPPGASKPQVPVPRPAVVMPQSQNPFLPDDDVFFGASFDETESSQRERITLDRGILDYAAPENLRTTTIDPKAMLNLPKPTASYWNQPPSSANGTSSALPSLAAITSLNDIEADQLELPSLMLSVGEDARNTGHLLNIEELLS